MKLSQNSKHFLINHITEILFCFEKGAGALIAAQCSDLVSAITHNVEDALDFVEKGDWGYEIAKIISDCDENALKSIFKAVCASEIGKFGGSVKSSSKSNAARENGKKGGRPKKLKNLL